MAKATLTISRRGESRTVELDPNGITIGRHPDCDIVLESGRVSRHHARIYRDPFGRWLIEDAGSKHGVWVRDERVEAGAILPGERIALGPFSLVVSEESDRQIVAEPTATSTSTVLEDDAGTELIHADEAEAFLGHAQIKRLNEIAEDLTRLTSARELYAEVCATLAGPGGMAAVLRLPGPMHEFSGKPEMLASRVGGGHEGADRPARSNIHLSRRVLEAVRTRGKGVKAGNAGQSQGDLSLTVVDQNTPRVVFCAPVSEPAGTVDVLYLDLPSERAAESTLDFVQAVARQVNVARKSLLFAEERADRQVLDQQLALARQIQSNLVPTRLVDVAGLDVSICYHPAMWVGGDYCDAWSLPDGRVAFAIGDVCGKGLPAALVMSSLQAALRTASAFCSDPAELTGLVNRQMTQSLPDMLFITLFLGVFDPATGRLEFVNAGHLPPILCRPEGVSRLGEPTNGPVGVHEGAFTGQAETIAPGTGLVVYTDGISEAAAPDDTLFGIEGILGVLAAQPGRSTERTVQAILAAAETHRRSRPAQDDITVFALRYRGTDPSMARTALHVDDPTTA